MEAKTLVKKNIPTEALGKSIATLNLPEYKLAYQIADKWLESDKSLGLFILGSPSSGRTTLGSYILLKLLKERVLARRFRFPEIMAEYYESWKMPKELQTDETIFLDDLIIPQDATQNKAGTYKTKAYEILSYRKERKFPTIVCGPSVVGNQLPADLSTLLKGNFIPIKLPAKDLSLFFNQQKINSFLY